MKFNKFFLIVFLFAAGVFTACEKDDPEIEYTSTYPLNGEWYVTYQVQDSTGGLVALTDHLPFFTYNTSDNLGQQMWIEDNIWPFKIKTNVNVEQRTFSVSQATSMIDDTIRVDINNGKVLEGAGLSRTGVKTDSIYMEAMFSDDPGTIYYISGHRRTGFQEDDYH